MATKLERTVVLPESIYKKIVRLAQTEQSNIQFVTRQLLVKGLADESKSRPDWFYELQSQIVALRNEVVVEQRAKRQEATVTAGQLLDELQKQIAEREKQDLAKPIKPVNPGFDVIKMITGVPWTAVTKTDSSTQEFDDEDHLLDLAWGLGPEDNVSKSIEEVLKEEPAKSESAREDEDLSYMYWEPIEAKPAKDLAKVVSIESEQEIAVRKQVADLKEAVFGRQEDATNLAVEMRPAEQPAVAGDKKQAKGNILRPFFGRLSKIFGVVLS